MAPRQASIQSHRMGRLLHSLKSIRLVHPTEGQLFEKAKWARMGWTISPHLHRPLSLSWQHRHHRHWLWWSQSHRALPSAFAPTMQSWDRFAWQYLSSSSRCQWLSTVSQPDWGSLQSEVLWPICAIFSFPVFHFGVPWACHFDIRRAFRQHSHYRRLHWLSVCLVIISSTRTWS